MSQADSSITTDLPAVEMDDMIARLDAVLPRPSREDEDARERRSLERLRRVAMWTVFGDLEEAA